MHVDQGFSTIQARKANYLVASDGGQTVGAIGYKFEEPDRNVRITELIARDDEVKGVLLRRAVEEAEDKYEAELIEADVSAYSPRIQHTLFDLGFMPAAYAPGMVFHETSRWDVVRMIKLNVAWDLKSVMFTEAGQAMFDTVSPLFIEADARRARKLLAMGASVLSDLTPLEIEFVQRVSDELSPAPGTSINADSLYIVLAGNVTFNGRTLKRGDCFGTAAMLGQPNEGAAIAGEGARLMKVTPSDLNTLSEKHPRLGLKLYRNLAGQTRG